MVAEQADGPSPHDLMQAAIGYANRGYRVFPCVPGGKQPATAHGCLDATDDEEQVIAWWTAMPTANIAISTDGLLVVDVDPVDGERNSFADDEDILSDLLISAGSGTPRGGMHFWFKQPEGGDFRNTTSKIAKGVDTRASGGYVLVPPSVVDGKDYHWLRGFELDVPADRLPLPPLWITDRLQTVEIVQREIGDDLIPDGCRNQTLTSIGGSLRRIGLTEQAILSALRSTNIDRCSPPLDDSEIRTIAWSVSRYEPDQIATAVAEGWAEQDAETVRRSRSKDPGTMPLDLLAPGGLLQDVIAWNCQTAYKPQPELALAAALSLMATITGRKVSDETGTRTNIYCLGVCETGGGKEHARKINKQILRAAGMEKFIGPEGIGSHAGVLSSLNANPVLLFQIDEFGRLLATLNNPAKAPHLYNVISVLLKLYTSSDSLYIGDTVADQKRVARIDQPHAVLYCTTVPENFLQSLAKESLADGFVSRLLVFDAANPDPDSQNGELGECPQDIAAAVKWWGDYNPGGNLAGVNPQPRRLTYTPEARAVFRELEVEAKSNAKSGREACKLWTRTTEKARKLALLHRVSLDRDAVEVDEKSAAWGCWLSHYLSQRMEFLATDWVSENQHEAAVKRVHRDIKRAGRLGLSLSEMLRDLRWLRNRDRDEILKQLVDSGLVICERQMTGGRPRLVYKATE